MGRDARGLPSGWDTPIPDAIWPEAMLSAIRHDVSALSSGRVIATIRVWRSQAIDEHNPQKQEEARRLLDALGRALLPPSLNEVFDAESVTTHVPGSMDVGETSSDDHTVDTFQLPPKPTGLRREGSRAAIAPNFDTPHTIFADDAIVAVVDSDTDSRVAKLGAARSPPTTGASAPPTAGFTEEDEKPTTAFLRPDTGLEAAAPIPKAPPPLPLGAKLGLPSADRLGSSRTELPADERRATPFDEDDKPTRHIDLPEAQRRLGSIGGPEQTEMAKAPPSKSMAIAAMADDDDLESTHALTDDESSAADLRLDDPEAPQRLAPKPGVIRRRSTRGHRATSTVPRPRAAMHHVRSLYGLLMPFAAELIPLTYERRSRRFWARWREVAGDRGVRRDFVEDLLRTAGDARMIVCELIGEVQSVDLKSVYALVDKLDADHSGTPARSGAPDRTRGPLVGASVRVEGVLIDED